MTLQKNKRLLTKLEKVITTHSMSFWEIGFALQIIKEQQLYKLKYPTFREYLEKRWHMTVPAANKMIAATMTRVKILTNDALAKKIEKLPLGINFYHAVSKLPEDNQQPVVTQLLATNTPLTSYQVNQAGGNTRDPQYYVHLAYRNTINNIKKMVKDKNLKRFFVSASKTYGTSMQSEFVEDLKTLVTRLDV